MDFDEVEFGSRKVARKVVSVEPPPTPARKRPTRSKSQPRGAARDSKQPGTGNDASDGVLVPLDQWTKILNQLGNLHQAGQELADARERAAKAETEALFLRERLRELRDELATERRFRDSPGDRSDPTDDVVEDATDVEVDVDLDMTTDRVLIVKLPSRLTRWLLERKSSPR